MDPEQTELLVDSSFLNTYFLDFQFGSIVMGFVILILIICSALISGSEVAFFSLNLKKRNEHNSILYNLLEKPQELLATILIVNNIVNISIVIFMELFLESIIRFQNLEFDITLLGHYFQNIDMGWVIKVIIVTSVLLIFGEILPKVYANKNAFSFSKRMAKPMSFLCKVFGFLSRFLSATSLVINKGGNNKLDIAITDLSKALKLTKEGGDYEEQKLLEGIVKFGNTDVSQIMTSRVDFIAISISASFDELIALIQKSGFSRIPVFQENMDSVKGVVYIKDLIQYLRYDSNFRWQTLIHEVFYVPENKKIDDLLKNFQDKKMHMAVVVDEYGGTSGLATLEDVLEEIVGDINNEQDNFDNQYTKLDNSTYVFEGKIQLIDFCRIVGVDESSFDANKGESETLGGLFLEVFGRFPILGDRLKINNTTFIIMSQEQSKINKIKVILNDE